MDIFPENRFDIAMRHNFDAEDDPFAAGEDGALEHPMIKAANPEQDISLVEQVEQLTEYQICFLAPVFLRHGKEDEDLKILR
jgi:hypothetical protein